MTYLLFFCSIILWTILIALVVGNKKKCFILMSLGYSIPVLILSFLKVPQLYAVGLPVLSTTIWATWLAYNKKGDLILIRGIPGSGKSTLAQFISSENNYHHIETDMYFTDEDGNYTWDGERLEEAREWCRSEAKKLLDKGENVIICNTMTTIKEIEFFKNHLKHNNLTVYACKSKFNNIHDVPKETVESMIERWENFKDEIKVVFFTKDNKKTDSK